MKKSREQPKSPVNAVQLVYKALEPFDEQARKRIVESAASLLGMRFAATTAESQTRAPQPSAASAQLLGPPSASRPLSPVELMQEKQPTTNAQKIAVFAITARRLKGSQGFLARIFWAISRRLVSLRQKTTIAISARR